MLTQLRPAPCSIYTPSLLHLPFRTSRPLRHPQLLALAQKFVSSPSCPRDSQGCAFIDIWRLRNCRDVVAGFAWEPGGGVPQCLVIQRGKSPIFSARISDPSRPCLPRPPCRGGVPTTGLHSRHAARQRGCSPPSTCCKSGSLSHHGSHSLVLVRISRLPRCELPSPLNTSYCLVWTPGGWWVLVVVSGCAALRGRWRMDGWHWAIVNAKYLVAYVLYRYESIMVRFQSYKARQKAPRIHDQPITRIYDQ